METTLFTTAGTLLLLFVAYDVRGTIIHSRGHNGPLSEFICQTVWRAARAIAFRLSREKRHHLLNSIGPILMPVLIVTFIAMLVVGFALIYYPQMPANFAIAEAAGSRLSDSLYFSGITLTTVGYGDIAPRAVGVRMIALAESASGFALISLAVTYLINVYSALERKRIAALAFYYASGRGADAVGFITHHYVAERFLGMSASLRATARDLHEVLESHLEHPITHYFHPLEVFKSLPRILFLSLETCSIIRSCIDEDEYAELYNHPEVLTLEASARDVIREFNILLRVDARAARPDDSLFEEAQRWQARFNKSIERLQQAGIKTRPDRAQGLEIYKSQRNEWERLLYSFASYLGYDWDEVTGDRDLLYASDEKMDQPRIEALR